MKALIYGAGATGIQVYYSIKNIHEVKGFLDGNPNKKDHYIVDDIICLGGCEALEDVEWDYIYVGSIFVDDIRNTLIKNGVSTEKIIVDIPNDVDSPVRKLWLEDYSKLFEGHNYSVAEGGVYRGNFAKEINRCFPNSKLYLFDTFEGFDKKDMEIEKRTYENFGLKEGDLSNTSVELVLSKMKYPENVIVKKGYFPDTASGIEDEFCFVNIDFDLFMPVYEGIKFFYPKMIKGSVLLIHDYYNIALPGVKDAVDLYEREFNCKLIKLPIGDDQSIAIVKI